MIYNKRGQQNSQGDDSELFGGMGPEEAGRKGGKSKGNNSRNNR